MSNPINAALNDVRPWVQLCGTVLITLGALKFFGFNPAQIGGEGWQIALLGLAVRSW